MSSQKQQMSISHIKYFTAELTQADLMSNCLFELEKETDKTQKTNCIYQCCFPVLHAERD